MAHRSLELEPLLQAVSAQTPAGPPLRESPDPADRELFRAVRDARNKAAGAERRAEQVAALTDDERRQEGLEAPVVDWTSVYELASAALLKSKDLWVAAWLIEALARMQGFAGIRDGYRLVHGFCDRFWDDLHPRPEPGDTLDVTFSQLTGLNGVDGDGTLIRAILSVPVTEPSAVRALSCADFREASALEGEQPDVRQKRIKRGAITLEMFEQAVAQSSTDVLRQTMDDLVQARDAFNDCMTLVKQRLGNPRHVPPSSRIKDTLDECVRSFRSVTATVLAVPPSPDAGEELLSMTSPGPASHTTPNASTVRAAGAGLQTRDDALRTLLGVAEYFRQTEPHSPVSYALDQIVRWAKMPLPELLTELVSDKSARDEIFKRAGIKPPAST